MRLLLALVPLLSGCHTALLVLAVEAGRAEGPYLAGTLASELGPSSVRTLGCLDVGLAPFDREAWHFVDLHIGNRCAHPERLDARQMSIRLFVPATGESSEVGLDDPRGEISRLHVGGAERGRERIRLDRGSMRLDGMRLCFDLEGVAPDAPSARPAPLCFERHRDESAWRPIAVVRT